MILARDLQPENASSPILVTELGMVTLARELQPLKWRMKNEEWRISQNILKNIKMKTSSIPQKGGSHIIVVSFSPPLGESEGAFSLHPSVKTPAFLFLHALLFWITRKWWVFLYIHAKCRERMGQTPKWLAADLSSGQQLRCFEVSPCPLERLAANLSSG